MDAPSDQTLRLGLPYIIAAQSLKHITHNEALQRLDALVHLAVLDRDRTSPPADPEDGDRHIVAAGATDGWAGQGGRLAVRQGSGWVFYLPRAGWRAFVVAEAADLLHDGSDWLEWGVPSLNPVPLVGINATADDTNRLAVKSAAVLLDHDGADHRLKINKALAADTASLLFQSGYSGRAEFGLTGDDDWRVKVSADGSAWVEALRVERASGRMLLPAALPLADPDQVVTFRHVREKLAAHRTYYVRSDGSDANDGLSNVAGGAFASLQKAMDVIAGLDCAIYNVTVQVGAGTYTAGLVLKAYLGAGTVSFIGDTTTPANVHISVASGNCVSAHSASGSFVVGGFKLTSGNTQDVWIGSRCQVTLSNNEYAGGANYRVRASGFANLVFSGTGNVISGGGIGFFLYERHAQGTMYNCTFTLSANLTYSGAFATVRSLAYIEMSANTFTLGAFTVTGPRYSVSVNAGLVGTSANANYFPGNSAGSAVTGGIYA
jgi:hypothetical protein